MLYNFKYFVLVSVEKYSKCYVWGAWQTSKGVIYVTATG